MATNEEGEIRLNDEGKRIPTRSDGPAAILRYLMTYCVCPRDKDYNRRAVDYLLKKLQDNRRQLRELIETITWRGTRPSKCFTIPRTLDGRFQVATRKGFPHVVYARIWRWEDLEKCQIIHIPTCKYGYDLNRDHICVNPYHYKKIVTAEEFYRCRAYADASKYKNKAKPVKKSKEATRSENVVVNDGGKEQGVSQQQQQQSQNTYQLTEENLIPIVVEHQSNTAEYIAPQQPHIPETYPICDAYANNNAKLLQGHGHNQSNTALQLHSGTQENENNFIQDNRNAETPAVSLSMCEQVILNQSDFQNHTLSNNQRQDHFEKNINLPAPSKTLLVNHPPLLSTCNQPSQDLVRGDVGSVPMTAMPPPLPVNQMPPPLPVNPMPPPLPMNQMPPPLPVNPMPPSIPVIQMPPSLPVNQMPPPLPVNQMPPPLPVNQMPPPLPVSRMPQPLPVNQMPPSLPVNRMPPPSPVNQMPPPSPVNLMPPPSPVNQMPPAVVMHEMQSPRNIPLSSNSMFVNSNRQIKLPPPSSTPLPNNPPTFSHSLFEDEDFQLVERQEPRTNCSSKSDNKNMSLNCTFERILAEGNSQPTANNNPLENTLNETLEQILSQVQNNDKKPSSNDQKSESAVLSNNTEPITTQSNIEVLNSKENLANDNVSISNCKEKAVSSISDVPSKNYSQKLEKKDTSLNCTIERILKENDSQRTANNNPLENTLNETLDQILSQVQHNDQKLSSADQKLENVVLSNNVEPITNQSNIELLNGNKNSANDNVSMDVSNGKEIMQQDNNQQLHPLSNFSHLIQNTEALSPISNVSPTDYRQKLENKDTSLNCTLERILTEDCTLERILKEDNSQQTARNNPIDNTLNETLDQILSEVQNNDKKLSSTEQKLEKTSLNNNTEPMTTQSNNDQAPNSNEDSADEPMEVSTCEDMIEQNNDQQLSSKSSISSIAPLSPISTIRSQSPISNTRSLSPDSNLLQLDSDNKKITEKHSNHSAKQKKLQSGNDTFVDEDSQETSARNNNAQENTSLRFSESMISFINNNIMDQTQMSSVSKCEQYLRNQSGETDSPAYIQPPTNNINNPRMYNDATILQRFQNSRRENNAEQVPSPVQSQDAELQRSNFNEFFNMPNMNCRNTKSIVPTDDPPLEHWCSIDYFELDTQVGETFKVKNEHTTVIVDGYLDPDGGNRFCLGRLTNVRRTEQSERTRMHIAQGISLELRNEGDIWLRCRAKNSVFVQAHFLDMQSNGSRRNSVHKIFSGECKKVFDLQRCYRHIKAQIATAQAALKVQLMSMGPPNRPIESLSGTKGLEAIGMNIDDLRRFCILQISFVKGWGPDYPRHDIKETPCWIEVHVHRALQILDNFLLLDKPIVRGMD